MQNQKFTNGAGMFIRAKHKIVLLLAAFIVIWIFIQLLEAAGFHVGLFSGMR